MFTWENLKKYINGDFDSVDEIEGSELMAPFLDDIIKDIFPEFADLSADEMRSDNVVEDIIIGADHELIDQILTEAEELYRNFGRR